MKLTGKIAVIITAGGVFAAAALFGAAYKRTVADAERGALRDAENIAESAFALIDQFIAGRRSGLSYIAANIAYPASKDEYGRARAQLERFKIATGVWADVILRDLDGAVIASVGTAAGEAPFASLKYREAFHSAVEGDTASTDVIRLSEKEPPVIAVLAPVYAAADRRVVRGVLDARLALASVLEILADVPPPYAAYLLNQSGAEIGNGKGGIDVFGGDHSGHPGVRQLSRSPRVSGVFPSLRGAEDALTVFASEPGYLDYHGKNWVLAIETPRAPVVARGRAIAFEAGGLLVASVLVIALFVGYLMRRYVLLPLAALSEGAAGMAGWAFDGFSRSFAGDEFGALAASLEALWKKTQLSQHECSALVREKTLTLEEKVREAQEKNAALEATKRAIVNVLDDLRGQEMLLKAERGKLEVTLRGIGDGVFVIDRFEVVTFFNSAGEGLTGYAAGDVVGRPYQETLRFARESDDETELKFIDEVFAGEHALRIHPTEPLLLTRKNGARIAVAASAAPLRSEQGEVTGVVVVFRDVSREREIDRAKSEFISLATHQLRTPLTTMKWIPEMLLEGAVGKFSPRQRKYINDLRRSSERLVQLINKLLAIARIESRRIEAAPEAVDVRSFLQGIKKDFVREIESRKQRLTLRLPKSAAIRTDPRILGEVIRNLLANAVKYTPNGGRIEVAAAAAPRGRIVFSVKDNGIGIPEAQQGRIFGKFFRADNAAKTDVAGTGLGLYLVKQLVELLGGTITFTSVENKGTEFMVTLPVAGPARENGGV